MSRLQLEREFAVSPDRVFAYVTRPEHVPKWWGHEDMTLGDFSLDLSKPGPWHSTVIRPDGGSMKMSGEVVAVDPPNSLRMTWGWHDDNDQRGHESIVSFEISANDSGGTRFVLTHEELPDDESARLHGQGWASAMRSLERFTNAQQ